ncbi:hypothetical protein CEXT_465191 [Caerostris extrusa]|uniref:Uncharacterized protein n=1 Tax=Caerostris extrusa TaxID=172846 RepID=A0AAV4WRV1_CAEEX|nr:hypothetical protein CEXT_465191 [Caerostris extrusa]
MGEGVEKSEKYKSSPRGNGKTILPTTRSEGEKAEIHSSEWEAAINVRNSVSQANFWEPLIIDLCSSGTSEPSNFSNQIKISEAKHGFARQRPGPKKKNSKYDISGRRGNNRRESRGKTSHEPVQQAKQYNPTYITKRKHNNKMLHHCHGRFVSKKNKQAIITQSKGWEGGMRKRREKKNLANKGNESNINAPLNSRRKSLKRGLRI